MGKKKKATKPTKNKVGKRAKQTKKVRSSNSNALVRKKDVKMKFKYKHPKLALALKIIFIMLLLVVVVGAGVVAGLIFGLWGDDLNIDITELVLAENSIIVDSEGVTIAELSGDENRKIITLEEMSPYLPKAYIAIEDERFMTHHGVDIKRTGKAILSFVTNFGKSTAGGGSTITQQLVKNITQEKESSGLSGVTRKLKEWYRAYQIEDVLSKDQILELYLNLIFVGGNQDNRGVEIAAEYYFNKSAKDLSLAQCAFIAGINHSPNRYNPYKETDVTEKITKRTKTVLAQMKKVGYINQEEYDTAVAEVEAGFTFENGAKGNVYSAHTDALISQLIEQIMEEKQISKDAATTYLYSSGLKIYSTQVSSIQNVMEEEAKKSKYEYTSKTTGQKAQGAAVVIDQSTGYVVGCIGQLGEKTVSRGQNRATQSVRQTGSAFKPLAGLVPGIEEGVITPATIYDNKETIFNEGKINQYKPKNYNNNHLGLKTVRYATKTSQNIPFVKIMAELGNSKSMEYLKKMGITTLDDELDSGLPMVIGGLTYGVSPLEMAGAYASIANDGTYIEPTFYSKVEDSEGKVVLTPNQKTEKVCSEDTAYMVKDLLKSVVNDSGGTATYCKIKGIDVAAKTGTSNDDYDRWLCGFTNYYTATAWIGFDQNEDIAKFNVNGSNPAGKLWAGIMSEIHKGLDNSKFEATSNIVTAKVCATSGRLATDKCTNTYSEIFIKGKLPESCDAHDNQYTVCSESGKLPNEFCPANKIVTKQSKYVLEKERLGLWHTLTPSSIGGETAPTEYCTIHKKVEVVKPVEKEDDDKQENDDKENESNTGTSTGTEEKPSNNTGTGTGTGNEQKTDNSTGTENNQKPSSDGNTSTEKPNEGNTNTSTDSENNNNNTTKPQT